MNIKKILIASMIVFSTSALADRQCPAQMRGGLDAPWIPFSEATVVKNLFGVYNLYCGYHACEKPWPCQRNTGGSLGMTFWNIDATRLYGLNWKRAPRVEWQCEGPVSECRFE